MRHEAPRADVGVLGETVALVEGDVVLDRDGLVRAPRRIGPVFGEDTLEAALFATVQDEPMLAGLNSNSLWSTITFWVFQRQSA